MASTSDFIETELTGVDSDSSQEWEVCDDSIITVPSLLDKLKSPTVSCLARKRKVKSNPPSGKKKCKGAVASEPHSISPSTELDLDLDLVLETHKHMHLKTT